MKKLKLILLTICIAVPAFSVTDALHEQASADFTYRQATELMEFDAKKSLELFIQAADAGHVSAMVGAAYCFEMGKGTKRDYAKAIQWYKEATKNGSLKACEALATIMASCRNPEFHDGATAVKCANLVVRKRSRDPEALTLLANAYLRNMESGLAVKVGSKAVTYAGSVDEARALKKQLADYERGKPVPPIATIDWVMEAAGKEVEWAVVELANKAADPADGMYDPQLALNMCEKAIGMGRLELYLVMGEIHFAAKRLDETYKAYQSAVKQGCSFPGGRPTEITYRRYLTQSKDQVFSMAGKLKTGYSKTETYYVTETHYVATGDRRGYESTVQVPKTRTITIPRDPVAADYLYRIAAIKGHSAAKAIVASMPKTAPQQKPTIQKTEPKPVTKVGGLPVPVY